MTLMRKGAHASLLSAIICSGCLAIGIVLTSGVVVAAEEDDDTGWSGEVNLNIANQTGTRDTFTGTGNAILRREWEKDKLEGRFDASYGITRDRGDTPSDDETTQDSQAFTLEHRRTLPARFFWKTTTNVLRDSIQDIELFYRLDSGPGYRFWEGEKRTKEYLDMNIGLGYRYTTYDDSPSPGPSSEDTTNLVDASFSFEYKNLVFDERLEIQHTGDFLLPANDTANWIARTEITFGLPITASWSFRTAFRLVYLGLTPDEVTNMTTVTTAGLAYKF